MAIGARGKIKLQGLREVGLIGLVRRNESMKTFGGILAGRPKKRNPGSLEAGLKLGCQAVLFPPPPCIAPVAAIIPTSTVTFYR